MKYLLLLLTLTSVYSQENFVTNTKSFLENNFITEISANYQNPLNTQFISSFFRLNNEFKAQFFTTEFEYFKMVTYNSIEYQGSLTINIIYFGSDEFNPKSLSLVLNNSQEYSFSLYPDSKVEFIKKSGKYYYSGHLDVPLLIFYKFIQNGSPKIVITGTRTFKEVLLSNKAHKFFFSFYNSIIGYYFDDNKTGEK